MSRKSNISLTKEIEWNKLHILEVKDNEKKVAIDIPETSEPLPRVTIITVCDDIALFPCSLYSWTHLLYPSHLLNWIILDKKSNLKDTNFNDPRIRIVNLKGPLRVQIREVLNMKWIETDNTSSVSSPEDSSTSLQSTSVPSSSLQSESLRSTSLQSESLRSYMFCKCGDVMYPDTLIIKHRALSYYKKDCIMPSHMAFYNFTVNMSLIMSRYKYIPLNGLYFKKRFWTKQNSEDIVAIPYIGNCITVGAPGFISQVNKSPHEFYKAFPPEIKTLIQKIIYSS